MSVMSIFMPSRCLCCRCLSSASPSKFSVSDNRFPFIYTAFDISKAVFIKHRSKNVLQYEIGMSLDILEVSFLVVQFGGDTDLWLRTCEASQSISRFPQ